MATTKTTAARATTGNTRARAFSQNAMAHFESVVDNLDLLTETISRCISDIEQRSYYGQEVTEPCRDLEVAIDHLVNIRSELAETIRPPRVMPWEATTREQVQP